MKPGGPDDPTRSSTGGGSRAVGRGPRSRRSGSAGAVYVCTEGAFPSRRLQQLVAQQQLLRPDVPGDVLGKIKFGDQIFVEHVADVVSTGEGGGPRASRAGTGVVPVRLSVP